MNGAYQFKGRGDLQMRAHGDVVATHCPICDSTDFETAWQIPMTRIDPPATLFGGYFNQVPTLKTPFELFCFSVCRDCESVFLNPTIPRERIINSYKQSTHYLPKMQNEAEWAGYVERYEWMEKYLPEGSTRILDAACGMGQMSFLAQRDKKRTWQRIVGLELSKPYVDNMRANGIEAHEFDIDRDDIHQHIAPDSIDFIVFFEAYEHVEKPMAALRKLMSVLRPGGRIFFSAQRYGKDVMLAIRPGEPIYIGQILVDSLEQRLNCRLVESKTTGSRFFIVLEKRGAATLASPPAAAVLQAPAQADMVNLTGPFSREEGECWIARLRDLPQSQQLEAEADTDNATQRSVWTLLEDGKPLGPAHTSHATIRSYGRGAFSHWKRDLYFSTSDGTDPNSNGRRYTLVRGTN